MPAGYNSFFRSVGAAWRRRVLLSGLLCGSVLPLLHAQTLAPPVRQWERSYGGNDNNVLTAAIATADGGYLLGGWTRSENGTTAVAPSEKGYGGADYWVIKLDAQGQRQWDHRFGGSDQDYLATLLQTRDGGYLLGGQSDSDAGPGKQSAAQYSGDYWLVRLDAQGTRLWDRTYGSGGQDWLTAVLETDDGGLLVGGTGTPYSTNSQDYYVYKTDAQGLVQWEHGYGGHPIERLAAMQPAAGGGYWLAGTSRSGLEYDKTQPSRGGADYWLVRIDANGKLLADYSYGGAQDDDLYALQPTRDGGLLLGGSSASGVGGEKSQPSRGAEDYWVVKVNAQGAKEWDRTYGGNKRDVLQAMQPLPNGDFLLVGGSGSDRTGERTQATRGLQDYWALSIDAQGQKRWDLRFGGEYDDVACAVARRLDGHVLLAGYTLSTRGPDKWAYNMGESDYWAMELELTPAQVLATAATTAGASGRLFPNPAREAVRILVPPSAAARTSAQLTLTDALGRVMQQQVITLLPTETSLVLPLTGVAAGLYQVRVQAGPQVLVNQRLQKE